ncbi:MAG: penicillin-binding protein 1A [Phormidesmis sp. CAN_BIN44]|nr:penicillin-binding protein 1A [Phormidesmis sp. CAN_BIN44]
MTDEPNKNRQMAPRSRRSRKNRRFASLLNNLRLPGLQSHLDRVSGRLNELKQKLPPPLKNPVVRRRLLWVGVLVGGFGAFKIAAWQIDRSLPNTADLAVFARPGTLTIKASDGSILHQLGPATREKLTIAQIPKPLIQAFIASEDRRFYEHKGVDYQAIVRAIGRNLTSGGLIEGGSTITQQLARVVFLNQDRSIGRKVREAFLAQKLEREVDKQTLLERYLNLVYLGSNAYGVGDAAWIYFSKSVNQLTLSESATIAGLPPAPSLYSPLVSLEKAKERRNVVLDKMAEVNYITPTEAATAKAEDLKIKPSSPKKIESDSPYFTYYVQQQLPKYVSKQALEAGGITIETTLNPKFQKSADKAIRAAIEVDGASQGFKQAAMVAIDPRNGEVRAMVGGYDFYKGSQFNRATQAQRQPGSTFKPFVYTTAMAAGFSPYRSYLDERFMVDGYQPKNYSNKYKGWINIRDALTASVNVVAVKALIDVGFDPVIKTAESMGIHSKLSPTYSMALGAYEVNLLELVSSYGTLAAQGKAIEPHGIRRIINAKGKVLYDADFKNKQVVDANTAAIMTWMLRNVVSDGTGRPAQIDRPVAGKTGTSEDARDLWFVGYIPQLVAGVWLGNDDNSPTWGSSGTAAYAWHQFMKESVGGMPVQKFPQVPENLDDRKGTIKANPVKPNRIRSLGGSADPDESQSERRYDAPAESSYSEPKAGRSYEPAPADPPPAERAPEPAPREKAPPESVAPPEPAPRKEAPAPADPAPAFSDPLPPPGN